MTNSDVTKVALDLIAKGGGNISPDLVAYLNRDFDPNKRDVAFDTEIFESALKGFFFHGANGYAFSDIESVFSFFNMTFDELYPEATMPFIKFATSYWTLKFLVRPHNTKLEQGPKRTIAWELLSSVEFYVDSLFFPTPGRHMINPKLRERDQRNILLALGVSMDIEEFVRNNPILIRDRVRFKRTRVKTLIWVLIFICIIVIILLKIVE